MSLCPDIPATFRRRKPVICEVKKHLGRVVCEGKKKRSFELEAAKFPPVERRRLYIADQLSPSGTRIHVKPSWLSSLYPGLIRIGVGLPGIPPIGRETRRRAPECAGELVSIADEQPLYIQVNKKDPPFFFVTPWSTQRCVYLSTGEPPGQATRTRMRQVCRDDNKEGFM